MQYRKIHFKILFIVIVLVFIIFTAFFLKSWIQTSFSAPLSFFRGLGQRIGGIDSFFETRKNLELKNQNLREERDASAFDYVEFEALKRENIELKELLNFSESTETETIISKIISRTTNPFTNEIIIDKGRLDGLHVDAPVLALNGIFIGRVKELGDRSAVVLLAIDSRSRLPARILGVQDALGLLEGHGVLFRLNMLPQDLEIPQNSLVVTEAFESKIPAGLIVGRVKTTESIEDEPFLRAVVLPPENINEISFVLVLKSQ